MKYYTAYYTDKNTGDVVNFEIIKAETATKAAIIAENMLSDGELQGYRVDVGSAPYYYNN